MNAQWQPIKSAPKTEEFLAFWPSITGDPNEWTVARIRRYGGSVLKSCFEFTGGWIVGYVDADDLPTHWMKSPAPPK